MKLQSLILATALSVSLMAQAQDATNPTFKGESEASAILIEGAHKVDTFGAKTKNTWNITDMDAAILFGHYTKAETDGVVSADAKSIGVRYERVLIKDELSAYAQAMYDEDPISGVFSARQSYDAGIKYFFVKNDSTTWLGELGYRYSKTSLLGAEGYNNYARIYTEVQHKMNENVSGKLWFEYLPNLKDSDQNLWNAEASLSVVMTSVLSLKTAYLVNHADGRTPENNTTWSTALVAKY